MRVDGLTYSLMGQYDARNETANFTDMKVAEPLVQFLKSKRITKPTPIQLQGIPTAYVIR